jgi:eukaryotic-like serine/threonine-protein kinase
MNRIAAQNFAFIGAPSGRRYLLDAEIGDGTLGKVFRARDEGSGRACAIKLLTMTPVEGVKDRLWRLVDDLRAVEHPALVRPFDSGVSDGRGFLVMDLSDPYSAETALTRGQLTPARVLRLGIDVASALEVAHARGLSHQALTPSSILLSPDDSARPSARLLGLGLLFAFAAGDERVAALLITPKMLPPELNLSGTDVGDPRLDIYGLGAVLSRLLTGHRPHGLKIEQMLAARGGAKSAPVIRALNPSVSPSLEAVVQRAMAPAPRDRFGTMSEFRAALESVEAHAS